MQKKAITRLMILLTLSILVPVVWTHSIPWAHAEATYTLTPFPSFTQEGNSVTLVLSVSNANTSTTYHFIFHVKDPANVTVNSPMENYTTGPYQTQFPIVLDYPSQFSGG